VRSEEHGLAVRARLAAVEDTVQELTAAALAAATAQAEKASRLPMLRQAESEAGAIVQKLILERESFERDRQRLNDEIAAARARLEQSKTDLAHEQSVLDETRKLLDGIEKESESLRAAQAGENDAIDEAGRRANGLRVAVEEAERAALAAAERVAADEARRTSLERQVQSLHQRAQQLKQALEAAQNRRGALQAQLPDLVRMAQAETAVKDAETALDAAKQRLGQSEESRRASEAALQDCVEAQRDADSALTKLKAEASALSDLLKSGGGGKGTPVLDAIRVEPGYERALAAAIGDALNASADITSPIHWRETASAPLNAPGGTAPLADKVEAPSVLSRALSLVGLAPSREAAEAAAASLAPGQTVVSPEGAAYRWDGLTVTGEVKSQAAVRLEQRNRLAQVETLLVDAQARAAELGENRRAAQAALDAARTEEREARRAVDQAFETLNTRRREHLRLQEDSARLNAQIESLNDQVSKAGADLMLAETDLSHAQGALAILPDPAAARAELAQLRQTLATERQNQEAANQHLAALQREAASRRGRLAALAADRNTMSQRADRTAVRIADLEQRAAAAAHALAAVEEKPKSVEEALQKVLSQLTQAEALRREAADALSEGEKALAEADRAVKQAEAAVAAAKETRAALNAEAQAAEAERVRLAEDIRERLQVAPAALAALAEFKEGQPLPALDQVQGKLERLIRERDTMGPVNLRADAEMQELAAKIEEIEKEKNDLIEAIARLRGGISKLNGEAKERLLASFTIVDGHFQTLFKRLFGGGHAHLALTDPDNPLESGLEIYASPPGKKLQAMTLLSGGEKALTALALIFGMFLTNPSPICVLDEVDAPLDDSNVDRFCDMLHEMAKTGTRFLVVTHHQLTMARMDRLFGVTMTERGVSQLVSVDLTQADLLAAE
jgi:chromosome segregation protein